MCKTLIFTLALLLPFSFASAQKGQRGPKAPNGPNAAIIKADLAQIGSACAADGTKAGCGNQNGAQGLVKCLRDYRKNNMNVKFSDACRKSLQKLRNDKNAKRS